MFRRWPFFQRLLSWTKPYAPAERGTPRLRALRLEQPARRRARDRARSSRGSWTARRTSRRARRWRPTSRRSPSGPGSRSATAAAGRRRAERDAPDGDRVRARDDRRRVPLPRSSSSRSASPSRSRRPAPGSSSPHHYADARPAETYAGKRCSSSASRTPASSSPPACCRGRASSSLVVAVAGQAVGRDAVARRRPGPLRPAVRGPRPGRRRRDPRRRDRPDRAGAGRAARRSTCDGPTAAATSRVEVDEVIAATGFVTPAAWTCRTSASRRSARAGCRPRRRSGRARRCPASTSRGRSARARKGLKKHGIPANSGAVHGARYNARVLAAAHRRDATSGSSRSGRASRPDGARRRSSPTSWPRRPSCATSAATSPGSSTADPAGGLRDDGVQPLAHVLDAGGPDALAVDPRGRRTGRDLPGPLHADRRARSPSTRSTRTRCCATTRPMRGARSREVAGSVVAGGRSTG